MTREEAIKILKDYPNCTVGQLSKVPVKALFEFLETMPHWIPVEERLPKFNEQVLVYGLCPNGCRLFYVDCLIQDINDNGYPKWDDDTIIPTHWMPIVPPRKEE